MADYSFKGVLENKVFLITLAVWAIAQGVKVVLGVIQERRFNFKWFIGTGGMPSSHAAGASALATSIGLDQGFNSIFFALAASFAIVTMFDAQGVRRSAGQQAVILNKILDDMYWKGKVEESRLKELVGHSPFQVLVGAVLGTALAIIFYGNWHF